MATYSKKGQLLPAIVLIVGSGIGIGFVQLASTRSAGYINDVLLTTLGLLFTMGSGLLWAEATVASSETANIPTLCKKFFGKFGMAITYFAFLTITFNYLINNIGVSNSLISSLIKKNLDLTLPPLFISLGMCFLFGILLFLGLQISSRINFILGLGLIFTFLVMFFINFDTFTIDRLVTGEWFYLLFLAPVITTAYTYQFIVPTLCRYLNNDVTRIKKAIFYGVIIIFLILVFWQLFLLEVIPSETLLATFEYKMPVFYGLRLLALLQNIRIWIVLTLLFSGFTSIITTGLALMDFFLDFFHLSPRTTSTSIRAILVIFILFPATFFSALYLPEYMFYSRTLISWLELIFVGAIPAWLVMDIRYQKKIAAPRFLPGGSVTLILFFFIALVHFYFQGANLIWTP